MHSFMHSCIRSFIYLIVNCKPFGGPPTLFWTLDLVVWGWGLGAGGLGLGAWGMDLALGWGSEAWVLGVEHMGYARCAMCYALYLMQY